MKKILKIMVTALSLVVLALTCVACSSEGDAKNWVDQLFCKHVFDDGVVTVQATCSEFGELTKTCSECGKTQTEDIEKIDHTPQVVEAKAATCTEKGFTDGTKCMVCDEVIIAGQELPALGHKVVEDKGYAATCLAEGLSDGTHCSRCNEVLQAQTKIAAKGHKLVSVEEKEAKSCSDKGHSAYSYCTVCDAKYGYEEYAGSHKNFEDGICDDCGAIDNAAFIAYYSNSENVTETALEENSSVINTGKVYRVADFGDSCTATVRMCVEDSGEELILSFEPGLIAEYAWTENDVRYTGMCYDEPAVFISDLTGNSDVGFEMNYLFLYIADDVSFEFNNGDFNYTLTGSVIDGATYGASNPVYLVTPKAA